MYKKIDKIRAHREALKHAWFNFDHSNTPEVKQIIVDYDNNPHWPGYGTVKILSDGPNGYCSFSTHQEFPLEYVKTRKEYGEYELIINGEEVKEFDKWMNKLIKKNGTTKY